MRELERLIRDRYGLEMELEDPHTVTMGQRSQYFGSAKGRPYVIKIEEGHMGPLAGRLMEWRPRDHGGLVRFPVYVQTIEGAWFVPLGGLALTIQLRTPARELRPDRVDLASMGEVIARFHRHMMTFPAGDVPQSVFARDFMFGEVPKAQDRSRLAEIMGFYERHSPDYARLTCGVIHNDLNAGNIMELPEGGGYLFLDFEHIKRGPLAGDLGVFVLETWRDNHPEGYWANLTRLLEGYGKIIPLSDRDRQAVPLFSLRYLYSDDNYYTYLIRRKGAPLAEELERVREKQRILSELLEQG